MHFQRFNADDPEALAREIATTLDGLPALRSAGDLPKLQDTIASLGSMLTTARREREAAALLAPAVAEARAGGPSEALGWLLLSLATANQYLDHRREAHAQFTEALALAESLGAGHLVHFVLAHWGRLLAEDGELQRARDCFERALALRVRLNHPRQASIRRLLDALAVLEAREGH
jgi:tetratricopeptide (TPR) repeat protein